MDLSTFLTTANVFVILGSYLITLLVKKQVELYFPVLRENKIFKRSFLPLVSIISACLIGCASGVTLVVSAVLGTYTSLFYGSIKALLNKSELTNLKDSIAPKAPNE